MSVERTCGLYSSPPRRLCACRGSRPLVCALTVRVILCAGVSCVPCRVYSNYVAHVLSLVLWLCLRRRGRFLCAAPSRLHDSFYVARTRMLARPLSPLSALSSGPCAQGACAVTRVRMRVRLSTFEVSYTVRKCILYTVLLTAYSLDAVLPYRGTGKSAKAKAVSYNTVLPVTECESSDQRTTDQWSPDPRRRGTLNSERSREFLVSRRHPPLSASGTMKTQG